MAFTLANMSVPVNGANNTALLMPKLAYRFRVTFTGFGAAGTADTVSLTRQVVDVARPQVNFPEITVPIYNSTVYLAGKPTWNPLSINIRDDANNEVTKLIGNQIQKQFDFANQASAETGGGYKFNATIEMLDGGNGDSAPTTLEKWTLYGCYIQDANYNALNYGTNEVMQISLTIRFDNAQQQDSNKAIGVGGDIGRAVTAGVQATDVITSGI